MDRSAIRRSMRRDMFTFQPIAQTRRSVQYTQQYQQNALPQLNKADKTEARLNAAQGVVNAVGANVAKLGSGEPVKIMSGIFSLIGSIARNDAVYKRPIGATVYFDGFTEKLQERDIFPRVRKIFGKSALSIRMAAVKVYQRSSDRSFI